MSLARTLLCAALAVAWTSAGVYAQGDKKAAKGKKADKKDKAKDADADSDDSSDDSSSDDSSSDDATVSDDSDAAPNKKGKAKAGDDSGDEAPSTNMLAKKQDLTGHDLGSAKKTSEFEKDRFFVDKVDTEKTEDTTLIQGSITSTSFLYHESGSPIGMSGVQSSSPFSRYYTDLRLQTDFRHIKASRWEGRVDARLRFVNTPSPTTSGFTPAESTNIQSGLNGSNEYDIRELWLIRNGERTDVIIGRQFIPDLGALKIDGMRVDYASSSKLTLLGFGGLYPLRGSRSITTDYADLKVAPGNGEPAGPFVGAGGFGGAYRTPTAYGSIGGVALVPLKGEEARVYATSSGYYRYGSVLDVYHFALIDLVGSAGAQLTNFSGGLNIKPNERLRLTASVNHVDTETLNVQANALLQTPDPTLTNSVQNEVAVMRLSTNEVRGSVSAGLGQLQRFQITVATAYRMRPEFQLLSPTGVEEADIPAAKGVEVYGGITDRHSFKDARIGFDAVQTFGTGAIPFQRTKFFAGRVFAAHDIKDGQGEWEAEVSYSTSLDVQSAVPAALAANPCGASTNLTTCFGYTNGTVISLGGTVYYRFNRDWFGIASLYVTQTSLKEGGMMPADPDVIGLSGFGRLAYRF